MEDRGDAVNKPDKEPPKKAKKVTGKASERLEDLLRLMDDENLLELEISDADFEVKLVRQSRQPAAVHHRPAPAPKAPAGPAAEPEGNLVPVKSPLAGVFYRSPSPQAPPFVKEGDMVTPERTVCIIEAMKVLNEINAGVSGKIVRILVENGKPISSGQSLYLVDPS